MTMTTATTTIINIINAELIREMLCQKYCRHTLHKLIVLYSRMFHIL